MDKNQLDKNHSVNKKLLTFSLCRQHRQKKIHERVDDTRTPAHKGQHPVEEDTNRPVSDMPALDGKDIRSVEGEQRQS